MLNACFRHVLKAKKVGNISALLYFIVFGWELLINLFGYYQIVRVTKICQLNFIENWWLIAMFGFMNT